MHLLNRGVTKINVFYVKHLAGDVTLDSTFALEVGIQSRVAIAVPIGVNESRARNISVSQRIKAQLRIAQTLLGHSVIVAERRHYESSFFLVRQIVERLTESHFSAKGIGGFCQLDCIRNAVGRKGNGYNVSGDCRHFVVSDSLNYVVTDERSVGTTTGSMPLVTDKKALIHPRLLVNSLFADKLLVFPCRLKLGKDRFGRNPT